MATTKTIQATVKNRTDTATNWTQKNPVLAEGEIIVVQTSAGETRLKIGDGVKTFTQLPYTDEQIYNNVVTSVNGQTGNVTLDIPDGTPDAVLYTYQTLTDEQKQQARENIEALPNLNNFPAYGSAFVGKSSLEDTDGNKISKGLWLAFQENTHGVAKFNAISSDGKTYEVQFVAATGEADIQRTFGADLDENGNFPQKTMDTAPNADMQIATKKYVDDKISDKELILSSSTVGSTKKFKLTIDDTGTLTASEITA